MITAMDYKEAITRAIKSGDTDKALMPFFEHLGSCRRSEYVIDGKSCIDYDWERSGITFHTSEGQILLIRLSVRDSHQETFSGWIGEGITKDDTLDAVLYKWGTPTKQGMDEENERLCRWVAYAHEMYGIRFEFSLEGDALLAVELGLQGYFD